jgi:anti-anti-sigma factor
MDLRRRRCDGVMVLAAAGRIDSTTSKAFEAEVIEVLDDGERRVVLDLSGVDYMSSAGIRVLLMATKRLTGRGRLVLCGLQGPVRQVLDLAGLFKLFVVDTTCDNALARLASTS